MVRAAFASGSPEEGQDNPDNLGVPEGTNASAAADADDAAKVEAERTVAELRQLLPARRWLKTETAVVEERRRGLQVYLDRVLQLPPAQSGTLGKVVELWVAAAMQRCSATEQF